MKPFYRHSLFALVIIAFFTAAPLLILHAQGYNLRWSWGFTKAQINLQATGMIKIDTGRMFIPISLDNTKPMTYRNPATLKGLTAGWHTISIVLEGYQTWMKKVLVNSGEVTHLNNIVLVPTDTTATKLPLEAQKFSQVSNFDRTALYYLTPQGPHTVSYKISDSLVSEFTDELLPAWNNINHKIAEASYSDLLWSADFSRFALATDDGRDYYFWFTRKSQEFKKLSDFIKISRAPHKATWDPLNANHFYFLTQDQSLYMLDFLREEVLIKIATNVQDFAVNNGNIFYITRRGRYQYLWQNKLFLAEHNKELIQLDTAGDLKVAVSKQGAVTIHNITTGELGLYVERGLASQAIIEQILPTGVKKIEWSPNGRNLLIRTDFGYVIYLPHGPREVPRKINLPKIAATTNLTWLADSHNLISWDKNSVYIADINEGQPWTRQLLWNTRAPYQIKAVLPDPNSHYLLIHLRNTKNDQLFRLDLDQLIY